MLTDAELERFSRQLLLPDFSIEMQERLAAARVLIVGCGGLGSPLALYLAAAGVGELQLADGDRVEPSNLHRQVLFGERDLGRNKATAAAAALARRSPSTRVLAWEQALSGEALGQAVAGVDLVADGTDNYPTRYALNRACIAQEKPLVSAAAARSEGQLATYHVKRGSACYRCVHPGEGGDTALSCRENGVLGPVVATVGSLQALEVIKVLTGWGDALIGRMLFLDLRRYEQRIVQLLPRPDCVDCAATR
jgi:adenylyltransferase/sulfurtransferase